MAEPKAALLQGSLELLILKVLFLCQRHPKFGSPALLILLVN